MNGPEILIMSNRFVHINLVARDWRHLAAFYEQVLGCVPLPPERDLAGPAIEALTRIRDAHICGIHLALPGQQGVTLELFQYQPFIDDAPGVINRPGFAHIAFAVDDVDGTLEAIVAAGGGAVGQVTDVAVAGAGAVRVVYATDPEGNIIELQQWST